MNIDFVVNTCPPVVYFTVVRWHWELCEHEVYLDIKIICISLVFFLTKHYSNLKSNQRNICDFLLRDCTVTPLFMCESHFMAVLDWGKKGETTKNFLLKLSCLLKIIYREGLLHCTRGRRSKVFSRYFRKYFPYIIFFVQVYTRGG